MIGSLHRNCNHKRRRFAKGGETAQRYVTAGERSEPAVIQTLKRGLRRSPIALPKHYSTSPKPISKAHFYPQVRFAHQRLRIVEPLQGSMTRFTSGKPPVTLDLQSSVIEPFVMPDL